MQSQLYCNMQIYLSLVFGLIRESCFDVFNKSSNISRLSLLLLFQTGGGNILVSEHALLSVICRECCPLDWDVNWWPCAGRVIPCAG